MARRALGRGLSALIADKPSATANNSDEELIEVDIDLITPNRVQPRSRFDETKLEELAQSIRENGIVQPILVRRQPGGFELVAGERRWRAAQRAGLQRIPAVVRDIPDEKLLELALIENIQRQELNPIEEAKAYKSLIDTLGSTQDAIGTRVGRDRSHVANILRLLKLPEDLQRSVEEEKLMMGHARALLGLTQLDTMREFAQRCIAEEMSVRELERRIKKYLIEKSRGPIIAPGPASNNDANYRHAETKLSRKLGTKVRIVPNQKGEGGKIEIEYYNDNDLHRIYGLLQPVEGAAGN